MATGKFVSYIRVSMDRQGRSGLGLEAQRKAVTDYLDGGWWELIAEFVELKTGKRDDRPKLKQALHRCKVTGATLVIAKLDRRSRKLAFIAALQDSGAKFVAADMPEAKSGTRGSQGARAATRQRQWSRGIAAGSQRQRCRRR
jgi:DNA invertase Pin-like site-specific DNA recombinase